MADIVQAWHTGAAPTRAEAEQERDQTLAWLRARGQADAAATLLRDWGAWWPTTTTPPSTGATCGPPK